MAAVSVKRSIVVNYIQRFNFVYKLQCFQGFLRRKKSVQRVLVLNLFFYFHIIKNHWHKVWFRARFSLSWYFWIDIFFAVCVSHVHVNTLNYALLFTNNRPIRLTQCCTQFKPFLFKEFPYHLNVNATI